MAILLVEDDSTLSKNIRESLAEAGFGTDVVYDGLLAERLLRKETYACVILDVNLPGRNGYDVCRNFRQYNKTTPVLMLTAFGELEDKVQGFENGADDYLTKPFYMKELLMRIRSLMKRSGGPSEDRPEKVLTAGDMQIEVEAKKVIRQGKELMLTPREYQILLKLIRGKGNPVSKEELIREIWGTSLDVNTNTVEVYINFLRKKVDKPFGRDSIRTKVGFGYYFQEA